MSLLTTLAENRTTVQSEIDALVATTETEKRDFTAAELVIFNTKIDEARALDERILTMEKAEESRAAADAVAKKFPAATGGNDRVKIVAEPAVYREGGQNSYFRDLWMGTNRQDRESLDRLTRNTKMSNEARALTSVDTAGGDFVPPIYLIDKWIRLARPGRVIADQMNKQLLPPGTDSINFPKVATGTTTAAQATQGSAISNTDATTSTIAAPVVTVAGQQTVSLQLLEQSPISMDEVILEDLAADYAQRIDSYVINGSGAAGQPTGILTVAGTSAVTAATATVASLYSKTADGIQRVHTLRYLPATHIFMHPRRWAFYLAAVDSNGRPVVIPNAGGPFNLMALADDVTAEGFVGTMQGVPVFVDANIPTNLGVSTTEDRIIVCRAKSAWLYEGSPRVEALPQTYGQNMQVLLRMYNYAAFTAARYPQSFSILAGAGLVAPTF